MKLIGKSAVVLFYLLILVAAATSCEGTNQSSGDTSKKVNANDLKAVFALSARTQLFLTDLENELNIQGADLASFKPSTELVETYNIVHAENKYFISGLIKTSESFDKTQLEKLGVEIGQPTAAISTVIVPLSAFKEFLQVEDITYFEISIQGSH